MVESLSFACVDVETTGLAPDKNEIIEIAIVLIENGRITDTYDQLVKPTGRITPFVSKLTGITHKMLRDAPSFSDIADDVRDRIGSHIFVAHNVNFDFDMVNSAFQSAGLEPLANRTLDTQDLALMLRPHLPSHKLSNLTQHFGIQLEAEHRALADTKSMAELLLRFQSILMDAPPIWLKTALAVLPSDQTALRSLISSLYTLEQVQKLVPYTQYLSGYKAIYYSQETSTPVTTPRELFDSDNGLRSQFSSFEARSSQQQMAMAIQDAYDRESHSVIEAPTGTGKSLAYLIPALLKATADSQPAIVCTKTKHLQSQICDDVMPKLCQVGLPSFTYLVLKGKDNYIDISRFDVLLKSYVSLQSPPDAIEFLGLFFWLLSTRTGDLSELHNNIYLKFYRKVNFSIFSMGQSRDSHASQCFLHSLRQAAKRVDLIITNHALFFSDVQAKSSILPTASTVIFDEAHGVMDAVSSAYKLSFSPTQMSDELAQLLPSESLSILQQLSSLTDVSMVATRIQQCMDGLFECATQFTQLPMTDRSAYGGLHQWPFSGDTGSPIEEQFLQSLSDIPGHLHGICQLLEELKPAHSGISDPEFELTQGLDLAIQMLQSRHDHIRTLLEFSPNQASWIEWTERQFPSFRWHSAPIQPAALLTPIFDQAVPMVLTSASLSISNSFDYFMSQLGLHQSQVPVSVLQLPCEFDLQRQAQVVYSHQIDSMEPLFDVLVKANGRTLVLFASYTALKEAHYAMTSRLKSHGLTVYAQRIHGTRESILQRYRSNVDCGIIFGLDSFWEGVDLPGRLLETVIMTKLPFSAPKEPLIQARIHHIERHGGNGFSDYLLPMAVLKFKQGVGRLIRTKTDVGTLIMLDSRLHDKSYGRHFLHELLAYQPVECYNLY